MAAFICSCRISTHSINCVYNWRICRSTVIMNNYCSNINNVWATTAFVHLIKQTPKNAKFFGSFHRIKALERIKWDTARKAPLSLTYQNSTSNSPFPQSFWCLSAVGRTVKERQDLSCSSCTLNTCNKVSVRTGISELENLISIRITKATQKRLLRTKSRPKYLGWEN